MSQFIEMFNCSAERVALSSLCDTFIDGDWIEAKDQSDSGIRLIQTGNVGVGTFKDKGDKARYISEDTFNRLNCTEVVEGDILISRLPDPVGRACIIPAGLGKSITAVDCTIIRLNDKVLPKFFVAFTSTPDYAMQIKKVLSGTTRLRVSRANLGKIQVPLPSVDKQLQFVTIAEQADKSGFDGLKSQFVEMFGNQDVNDRSWNESIVKDEFTLTMGKTPARNNPAFWQSGTNKWISISDMARYGRYTEDTQESITDIAVAESGIKIVPKGTIIMSFKLSIGRTAVTSEDIYTNEAIMAFRDVDETKFNMTFLQFLIANKNWLLNAKQAVKGQTLNKESIGNARIIVPPIGLQEQFAAIYNQADKSGSVLQYMIAC